MSFDLEVTERAAADIDGAMAWWAEKRSVAQALKWYVGIRLAMREIAEGPRRYPPSIEQIDAGRGLREMHFGLGARPTHRVVFQIEGNVVRVLTVRHVAQDELSSDDFSS